MNVCSETMTKVENYTINSKTETIENQTVVQYGIEQTYLDENGELMITCIDSISDDKSIVEELVKRLSNKNVDPSSLNYIVEDFLNEIFGM